MSMKYQHQLLGIVCIFLVSSLALILYNLQFSGKQVAPAEDAQPALEGEPPAEPAAEAVKAEEEPEKSPEEGAILLYSIDLHYANGELSEQGSQVVEGSPPNKALEKFIDAKEAYVAKILSSDNEVLDISRFDLGLFAFDIGQLEETYLTVQLSYFPNGKTIEIYDPEGVLKLTIDVSSFSRPENARPKEAAKPVPIVKLTFDGWNIPNGEILDASGNSNNGAIQFAEGADLACESGKRIGKGALKDAMFFDGRTGFLKIDDSKNFTGDVNGFSVSGWIYPVSLETGKRQTIISKQNKEALYALSLVKDDGGLGKLNFSISGENKTSAEIISVNETKAHEWAFFSAVWDKEKMRLYINGSLESEAEFKGQIKAPEGSELFVGGVPSGENFNGFIDDLTVYNGPLSQQDITEIFKGPESIEDFTKVYNIQERMHLFSFEDKEEGVVTDSISNTQMQANHTKTTGLFGSAVGVPAFGLELPVSIKDQNSFSADLWITIPQNLQASQTLTQFAGSVNASAPKSLTFINGSGIGIRSYLGRDAANGTVEGFYQFKEGEYLSLSGKWSNLAVVFEPTENSTKAAVYLNSSLLVGIESPQFQASGKSRLIIGANASEKDNFNKWDADEISIYGKPLSAMEIEKLSKRKPVKKEEPLGIKKFLDMEKEYACRPALVSGTINSKDNCTDCEGQDESCVCENKVIDLIDKDGPAEAALKVRFLKDDKLYKSLEAGSPIIANIWKEGEEYIFNFMAK